MQMCCEEDLMATIDVEESHVKEKLLHNVKFSFSIKQCFVLLRTLYNNVLKKG